MKNICIYMHRNKINGKVYIGQTCNPQQRWSSNGEQYKKCIYFYRAIQKYGWNNFEHIVLEDNLTIDEANLREQEYILKYNSLDSNFGYNMAQGGSSRQDTEIIKQHKREAQLKRYENPEEREKARQLSLKRYSNPEEKEKTRIATTKALGKKVICIETQQIFDSIAEAGRWAGLKNPNSSIGPCVNDKRKSAGKHPDTKQPLHWKYYMEGQNE